MNDDHLRRAADFFHDREGDLLPRTEAVTALARTLDMDATTASELLAGLTGDEVDPVIAVRTARETFVGVLDYHEGDGWYGFVDYHDFRGEFRHGVCARCVHEATTDTDVYTVTAARDERDDATAEDDPGGTGTEEGPSGTATKDGWNAIAADLRDHLQHAHPGVTPESVTVRTGAVLRSRTTVGGNRVWHVGSDGAGSGFDSASVDGFEATTLNRGASSVADRHLAINRLGLKAWYEFDFGSGTTVYDRNTVGGTLNGSIDGATWTTGWNGNGALEFTRSNYEYVGNLNVGPEIDDEITVVARVRPYSYSASNFLGIVTEKYNPDNNDVQFELFYDGTDDKYVCGFYDGNWHKCYSSSTNTTTNSWFGVAGTYDGSTLRLYEEGSGFTNSVSDSTGLPSNDADWEIGRRHDYYDDIASYWDGEIGLVRVYGRALSSDEITAILNGDA